MLSYFVTGTGTNVGKTVVTTLLTDFLSDQHTQLFPYKPIQTGANIVDGKLLAPDPEMYKHVFKDSEFDRHCTYVLQMPSSPHLAAEKENVTFHLGKIHQHITEIEKRYDGIVVEGAGGLYVPMTKTGYCMIDFMKELMYPVILVGEAGLGTINHTVLSIKVIQAKQIPIAGIILNGMGREDETLENDNIKMIEQLTNVPVVGTVPFVHNLEQRLKKKEERAILTKNWDKNITKN
ncbi:dethiobiotin synthase [Pseudogracilibacillus auburnensis]|uniref:ATP-dependent dethiobiotin synthetase BioD n=1 Tax=Pseudogracilibacillus auburnensis TaxID=1494959 RepID=A0A2V3W5Z0_9BACI|nr:dethiobiotin synthase [Pseudogracilibacillus auburnensis]PXW89430.1 dethiobiotin synthase [Pseudogracilibacillus auburnensis]